ncbi:MAG TPA: methyl-accepting chemotaxis protein [Verrucomicrobiae bacterium]|nr:methyl-accepting chemotaxis protein [Verrucomicrobiae bacterium]
MLKKLKVTHKLVLMVCGIALPLVAVTFFATIKGVNKDINFAVQEKKGNAFQRPLQALLDALPQHQWYASAVARGDQAAKAMMLEKQVQIDQIFVDLEAAAAKYGNDLQFTEKGLSAAKRDGLEPRHLKANWQKLKASAATSGDSVEQHKQLIAAVRGMIDHAGDTSNLILDPDLDSYYLMDITLLALPQTQERLATIITYGNEVLRKEKNSVTPKELAQFTAYAALLKDADVDRINAGVNKSLTYDAKCFGPSPTLQRNLSEPLQTYNTANRDFLALLTTAAASPGSVGADAFVTAGQNARAAAYKLWKASADELDVLLGNRASSYRTTRWLTLLGIVLALGAGVTAAFFVARSIVRPLTGLMQATARIARGDTNVRAPVLADDEIGALANGFNTMIATRQKAQAGIEAENKRLQANIQELLVVVSDASDGKLGVRARVSEGVLGNVCDALNLMLENVGGIIANAKSASDQVAAASTGISTVAAELEKGEQKQTQEILNTSEGVRDLNGKAQKVLENCQAATQAAENGRKAAEQGAKAVREVIKGMEKIRENTQANAKKIKRLGDRSMEISGIVKVIGDISAKTDMLALNASIEAARAGEQGRGFTIVAEQVRSLADRTKTLTNQIEKLVSDIQKETGEAVAQMETQTQEVEAGAKAAQSAGGTLENIVNVSTESSELVSQINQSASQQATRTQEMLATVETINQVVADAAVKVRETRSTSEQLLALSAELNKRLAQFEVTDNSVVYEQADN